MNYKTLTTEEHNNLIKLYESLTLEQCIELYLKQKQDLDYYIKTSIKIIIGLKAIYKENYKPSICPEGHKKFTKRKKSEKLK